MDLQVKLAQLVCEEMLHYEQVLELMAKRGQQWAGLSAGRYAGGLRKEIRTYEPEALIDVLVIGAFVEARSCERFMRWHRMLMKSWGVITVTCSSQNRATLRTIWPWRWMWQERRS